MKDETLLLKINVLLRKEVRSEVEIEHEGKVEEEDKSLVVKLHLLNVVFQLKCMPELARY